MDPLNIPRPQGAIVNFSQLIAGLLGLFILSAGLITFVYIMLGGLRLITAGGNKENAKAAMGQIMHAMIGLIVVLAAWGAMTFMQQLTGACFGIGCGIDILMMFNPNG